jgi:hypothetical protein
LTQGSATANIEVWTGASFDLAISVQALMNAAQCGKHIELLNSMNQCALKYLLLLW